ncbi:hypothetical protein OIO90_001567 [Microbotryomycetes sp. JL221]|nr:hypothetical protein OIO90_001567 [Microbotryomycetes sp. JL221]
MTPPSSTPCTKQLETQPPWIVPSKLRTSLLNVLVQLQQEAGQNLEQQQQSIHIVESNWSTFNNHIPLHSITLNEAMTAFNVYRHLWNQINIDLFPITLVKIEIVCQMILNMIEPIEIKRWFGIQIQSLEQKIKLVKTLLKTMKLISNWITKKVWVGFEMEVCLLMDRGYKYKRIRKIFKRIETLEQEEEESDQNQNDSDMEVDVQDLTLRFDSTRDVTVLVGQSPIQEVSTVSTVEEQNDTRTNPISISNLSAKSNQPQSSQHNNHRLTMTELSRLSKTVDPRPPRKRRKFVSSSNQQTINTVNLNESISQSHSNNSFQNRVHQSETNHVTQSMNRLSASSSRVNDFDHQQPSVAKSINLNPPMFATSKISCIPNHLKIYFDETNLIPKLVPYQRFIQDIQQLPLYITRIEHSTSIILEKQTFDKLIQNQKIQFFLKQLTMKQRNQSNLKGMSVMFEKLIKFCLEKLRCHVFPLTALKLGLFVQHEVFSNDNNNHHFETYEQQELLEKVNELIDLILSQEKQQQSKFQRQSSLLELPDEEEERIENFKLRHQRRQTSIWLDGMFERLRLEQRQQQQRQQSLQFDHVMKPFIVEKCFCWRCIVGMGEKDCSCLMKRYESINDIKMKHSSDNRNLKLTNNELEISNSNHVNLKQKQNMYLKTRLLTNQNDFKLNLHEQLEEQPRFPKFDLERQVELIAKDLGRSRFPINNVNHPIQRDSNKQRQIQTNTMRKDTFRNNLVLKRKKKQSYRSDSSVAPFEVQVNSNKVNQERVCRDEMKA